MVLGCLACARTGWADEITFSNGERLTGKLVNAHGGSVTFQSDRLGILQIPPSADMSLVVTGIVVVRTTDGKRYEGSMRAGTSPGWTLAIEDNTQLVVIPPTEVASITRTADVAGSTGDAMVAPTASRANVWDGATDRPGLIGPWSVSSTLALSGVNATKSRRLLHWNGELDNTSHLGTFKFTAERVYSTSTNQSGKEFIDDDHTKGEANYASNFTPRTSGYADFEGLHDVVSSIDKRLDLSAGLQSDVVKNSRVKLTAFVGPSFIHYSYLANQNKVSPAINFGAIQFGYRSAVHLPLKLTVEHDFKFNQGYRGDGSYLSYVDFRAKRAITNWLSMNGKISDDFDSKSAYRANPNTFRYSAGVGVTFDAF